MAMPIRTLAEKVVLRHSICVTPETKLLAAVFGQALGDLYSTHADAPSRRTARTFLGSPHATKLAGFLGLDIELVREWMANLDAWHEQTA